MRCKVLTRISVVAALAAASLTLFADDPVSPWDKGQSELAKEPVFPIRYPTAFERERETLGYKARFMPGMLSFTPDNRPVMRVGLTAAQTPGENRQRARTRLGGEVNLIQYLGTDGKWRVSDGLPKAIRAYLKLADGDALKILFGERTPDAVEFDAKGGAYTLATAEYAAGGKPQQMWFLVYSPDEFKTFEVTALRNVVAARLEPYRVNADSTKPPWILAQLRNDDNRISLIKTAFRPNDGKLVISKPVALTPGGLKPAPKISTMAGDGASMISTPGKTFMVYAELTPDKELPGTAQYIIEYDHASGKVSAPVRLGSTGHKVDGHNLPVIDVDSKGFLHVLGGSHWHSFKHWVSKKPFSALDGWSDPEPVGAELDNRWSRNGLSYPGMLIDRDDTIHLVARGRNQELIERDKSDHHDPKFKVEDLNYALVYYRKPAGKPWDKRVDLVIPAWNHYSNWYHKVALDRRNRLYCTYYYYASWLKNSPEVTAAYRKLWPEDIAPDGTLPDANLSAHDPVLIRRADGKWSIVRTPDFK